MMKELHGIDMELTRQSKLLSDIPPVDTVITMGCNVHCPHLPCECSGGGLCSGCP